MPRIENVTVSSITGALCIWKGCNRKMFLGDNLPAGWKCIVVAPGSLFLEQNLLGADVDGFLCPEHFAELYGLFKIGQRYRTI